MASVSNNNIAEAIYLSLKDKPASEFGASADRVIKFLIKKRLLSKSKDILKRLESIINKNEGIILAKVSSAEPLSEENKKNLVSILKNKYKATKVLIEEFVDKGMLGGLKVEVNNEVVDMSIKTRLTNLQENLTK